MFKNVSSTTLVKAFLYGALVLTATAGALALFVGEKATPTGTTAWNFAALVNGKQHLPDSFLWWFVLFELVLLGLMALVFFGGLKSEKKEKDLAERLGTGDDLAPLKEKAATKDARQLHPQCPWLPPGQVIGRAIADNAVLYQGWRSTALAIIAPGGGKTSRLVIPRMAAAPGAAFMTGNKVDGVPEVIAARRDVGQILILDAGKIYRRESTPDFIVNFARLFKTFDHDEVTILAEELAKSFIVAAQKNNVADAGQAKDDAHFGPAGTKAFAWFLLAAAMNDEPVWKIHEWAFKGELERVATLLDQGGFEPQAIEIRGMDKWPDKTRGSLVATLQRMCADLGHSAFRAWTTPSAFLREFDPDAFLDSKDTLILLSERRPGGTGAVIAALLKFIFEAAKRQTPGESRLRVPLVGELDEVANIAPWPSLPEDYSHFGSRGLCITTYLQAYSQGVQEWGAARMKTLWQTAGIRIVGANEEDDFTQGLSRVVGTYEKDLGEQRGSRSAAIAGVEDFANLPEFHVIVFSPKTRPAVVKLQGWFEDKVLRKRIDAGKAALKEEAAVVIHEIPEDTEKESA